MNNTMSYINENYIIPKKWDDLVDYLEDKLLSDCDSQNEEILTIYRQACYINFTSSSHYSDFLYQHYQQHHWLYSSLIDHAFTNHKSDLLHKVNPSILLEYIAMTIADDDIIGNFFASAWVYRGLNRKDPNKWPSYDLAASFLITIMYFIKDKKTEPLVRQYFNNDITYQNALKLTIGIYNGRVVHKHNIQELQQELEYIAQQRDYWQDYHIDNSDAWIKTLSIFKKFPAYKRLYAFFSDELSKHNLDIRQCLVLCFNYTQNIGENFMIAHSIVSWAKHHDIKLVAAIPPKHDGWMRGYFGQYCAHIMISNERIPGFSGFIPVAPGNIIAMNVINIGFAGKYLPGYDNTAHHNDLRVATRSARIGLITPEITIGEDIISMFQQYQLVPNKTIILSLLSVSLQKAIFSYELLHDFWCDLVIALQQQGYNIVINAPSGESRDYTHIKNTILLDIPLHQIVAFVNYAGYFIGERSGLCDMLSISDAKRYYIDVKGYIEYPSVAGFTRISVDRSKHHENIDFIIDDL